MELRHHLDNSEGLDYRRLTTGGATARLDPECAECADISVQTTRPVAVSKGDDNASLQFRE